MASVTAGMAVSAIQPKTSSNIGLSLLIAFATQGTAVLAIQPKTFWKTGFNLLIAPSIEPTPPIALSIDSNMSATPITTHEIGRASCREEEKRTERTEELKTRR